MDFRKEYQRSTRKSLDMEQMQDIRLSVSMVLGKKNVSIKDILNLSPGSILELNRVAGENVDLMINEKNMAKGEVVVVNNHLGFRLVTLLSPDERLKNI